MSNFDFATGGGVTAGGNTRPIRRGVTSRRGITIGPSTFDAIEDWMDDAARAGQSVRFGMNALVMLMAHTNQAIAMKMSGGPVDPQMRNPNAAWKIPVRRISGKYYRGWKVRRLAPGAWILYNDTREAFFIEHGINHVGSGWEVQYRDGRTYIKGANRVRRPIRKLSLIQTLKMVDQSRAGERVWETIFGSFRPGRGNFRRGSGVMSNQVQAVRGMTNL